MSADGITGQYDNCLFSLHMPQKLGKRKKEDDKVKRMVSGGGLNLMVVETP